MRALILAEPFRAWLELRVAQVGVTALANEMGVDARQLYRWRFEAHCVELEVVEDALDRAGVHLWEVYGEFDAESARQAVEWERFWDKVPERPADPDACWVWVGKVHGRLPGTPAFVLRGHVVTATRFIYRRLYGDPGNHRVLRRCRNHRCVRPEHLYITGEPAEVVQELVAA